MALPFACRKKTCICLDSYPPLGMSWLVKISGEVGEFFVVISPHLLLMEEIPGEDRCLEPLKAF